MIVACTKGWCKLNDAGFCGAEKLCFEDVNHDFFNEEGYILGRGAVECMAFQEIPEEK